MIFEDPSHFVEPDNPAKSLTQRVYGIYIMYESRAYCLRPAGWFSELSGLRNYQKNAGYYIPFEKYGSVNDIVIDEIKLDTLPFDLNSNYKEVFSIESIEKKKNDLCRIRKKIDGFMVPLLDEFFPKVLTSIIIDYFL